MMFCFFHIYTKALVPHMVFLIVLLIMSTLLVAPCSASLPAVVRSRVRAATLGGLVGDALALAFRVGARCRCGVTQECM